MGTIVPRRTQPLCRILCKAVPRGRVAAVHPAPRQRRQVGQPRAKPMQSQEARQTQSVMHGLPNGGVSAGLQVRCPVDHEELSASCGKAGSRRRVQQADGQQSQQNEVNQRQQQPFQRRARLLEREPAHQAQPRVPASVVLAAATGPPFAPMPRRAAEHPHPGSTGSACPRPAPPASRRVAFRSNPLAVTPLPPAPGGRLRAPAHARCRGYRRCFRHPPRSGAEERLSTPAHPGHTRQYRTPRSARER